MRLRSLEQLIQALPQTLSSGVQLETIRSIVALLEEASVDNAFILDCVEALIIQLENGRERPSLFYAPNIAAEARIFFWPPMSGALPHEHSGWTVSCVLMNRLRIKTYDAETARGNRRLACSKDFYAEKGQAGYIEGYGIHGPLNDTTAWTATIHFLSQDDAPVLANSVPPVVGLSATASLYRLTPSINRDRADPDEAARVKMWQRHVMSKIKLNALVSSPSAQLTLQGLLEIWDSCVTSEHFLSFAERIYKIADLDNSLRLTQMAAKYDSGLAALWASECNDIFGLESKHANEKNWIP